MPTARKIWDRYGFFRRMIDAAAALYDRIVDPELSVRRLYLTASRVIPESQAAQRESCEQLDLLTDYKALEEERKQEAAKLEKEKRLQKAMLDIKKKYGRNADPARNRL